MYSAPNDNGYCCVKGVQSRSQSTTAVVVRIMELVCPTPRPTYAQFHRPHLLSSSSQKNRIAQPLDYDPSRNTSTASRPARKHLSQLRPATSSLKIRNPAHKHREGRLNAPPERCRWLRDRVASPRRDRAPVTARSARSHCRLLSRTRGEAEILASSSFILATRPVYVAANLLTRLSVFSS